MVTEGQLEEDRLEDVDTDVVKLNKAVGLTLVVVERETLCVPEPQ